MFPLETGKLGLMKIDFEILDYLEFPKTFEELKVRFPDANVAKRLLDLQDKNLILEKDYRYSVRFYTNLIKKIIDKSNVPDQVKKNFHFFMSQMDNPFVREKIYDENCRKRTENIMSIMTKSTSKPLLKREMVLLKIATNDLIDKLR